MYSLHLFGFGELQFLINANEEMIVTHSVLDLRFHVTRGESLKLIPVSFFSAQLADSNDGEMWKNIANIP